MRGENTHRRLRRSFATAATSEIKHTHQIQLKKKKELLKFINFVAKENSKPWLPSVENGSKGKRRFPRAKRGSYRAYSISPSNTDLQQHRQLLGKRVTYRKLKEKTKKMLTPSHYKTPQIFSLKHNPVAETNSKACWQAKAKPPHLHFWAPSPSLLWDYNLIIAASLTEGHRPTSPTPKPASHCETPAASPTGPQP